VAIAGPAAPMTIHVPEEQPTIQAGISAASAGDTVVVACDTYYEHDIVMKSGVHLRSATGAAGCAVIDAQLQGRGFLCVGLGSETEFVGITIKNGKAVGDYPDNLGGGMYCSSASPVLKDMVFFDNFAGSMGGGLCCRIESNPALSGVLFLSNRATDHGGGIEFWECPSATLADVTLARNNATYGGAISCFDSSPTLTNVTMALNSASYGGGVYCSHWANPTIRRSILSFGRGGLPVYCYGRGEPDVLQCVVFGDATADTLCGTSSGVLKLDPRFCAMHDDDYSLCSNSPCLPSSPANPWGVLIGAVGQGCSDCDSPVAPSSWGRIKALYR
jgi:hypothetical protein